MKDNEPISVEETLVNRRISMLENNLKKAAHLAGVRLNVTGGKKHRIYIRKGSGLFYLKKSEWNRVATPIAKLDFERKVLKAERKRLCLIKRLQDIPDAVGIMEKLHPIRKELLSDYRIVSDEAVAEWLSHKSSVVRNRFWWDDHPFLTERGDRVRSKSEAMIANHLYFRGVPYKYEFPIQTSKGMRIPDFIVLNRRTGMEYVYEHFGLVDDAEYIDDNLDKLEDYEEEGITLWVNLVVTYESRRHPFDIKRLDRIIERFFM